MSVADRKAMERAIINLEIDSKLTEVQRCVAVLLFAAREFAYNTVPLGLIVRKALCLSRTPSEDSEQVAIYKRNRMTTVRTILQREYSLGLVAAIGFGFRATVPNDWNDYFAYVAVRVARRAGRGNQKLLEVLAPIPPDKLNEDNRKQFREYKAASKVLTQGGVVNALLENNVGTTDKK